MYRPYSFIFSQKHVDFRYAEIESLVTMFNISVDLSRLRDTTRRVHILLLSDDEAVQKLLSRSMLIKSVTRVFAIGVNYDELYAHLKSADNLVKDYNMSCSSFAIRLKPIGRKRTHRYVLNRIEELEFLPLDNATVDLDRPDNIFQLTEECDSVTKTIMSLSFGRLIGHGQGKLKSIYNLQDRCYIGGTTIDPELGFLMSNLAAVQPNSLVLDPFAGTGGILLAAAHHGGSCCGVEINFQTAHAVGRSSRACQKYLTATESVRQNFVQYGLVDRFVSLIVADSSRHDLWQQSNVFDTILADPPYGVREKCSKIASNDNRRNNLATNTEVYYPSKMKYALNDVFFDLLTLAARLLVIGGRIAYWFPIFSKEYDESVLPRHDALRLIANCEQPLTVNYSRRLLVMMKVRAPIDADEKAYVISDCYSTISFRDRVFTPASTVVD